jgi:hypothetical protein
LSQEKRIIKLKKNTVGIGNEEPPPLLDIPKVIAGPLEEIIKPPATEIVEAPAKEVPPEEAKDDVLAKIYREIKLTSVNSLKKRKDPNRDHARESLRPQPLSTMLNILHTDL